MSVFDTNLMWDESEVCNECKADDRREDHDSECDCYCHNPAKIRFFEGQLKVADALAKAIRNHGGGWGDVEEALATYDKVRNGK